MSTMQESVTMNNQHKLDTLLAQARNAPPVISFSQSEQLVRQGQLLPQGSLHTINYYRRGIMVASIMGIIGVIASVLVWEPWKGEKVSNHLQSSSYSQRRATPLAPNDSNTPVTTQQQKPQKRPTSQGRRSIPSFIKDKTHFVETRQKSLNDSLRIVPAAFIDGIKMIELTDDELGKIGVTRDKGDVWIQNMQSNGVPTRLGIKIYGEMTAIGDKGNASSWISFPKPPPIYPQAVTDDLGNRQIIIGSNDELGMNAILQNSQSPEELTEAIDQVLEAVDEMHSQLISGDLIPILVRTGRKYTEADRLARHWRPDCILWFRPTATFLQALPERVRRPVECQLKLGESLRAKPTEEQAEQFIQRSGADRSCVGDAETSLASISPIPGQAFIDTWRSAAGAITESTIIPSPEGQAVKFQLVEPRMVSLAVYDIHGRLVQTLSAPQHRDRGQIVEQLSLQDISSGIYLLTIQTNHGERAVQRIMVENKSATLR